jgi:hypothetical protein
MSSAAAGQTPPGLVTAEPESSTAVPTEIAATAELTAMRHQVELLQAELQVMRSYHSSLLDTVYWSLGGVFVLASLLLGFSWLANLRIYERDKQALQSVLDARLGSRVSELEAAIDRRKAELAAVVEQRMKEASAAIPVAIRAVVEPVESQLKTQIGGLERDLTRVRSDILRKNMTTNPSANMALTDALMLLELLASRSVSDVPEVVTFMLKTIDKGGKFTGDEIARVNLVLDKLPPQYGTLAEKLRGKIVASDVF